MENIRTGRSCNDRKNEPTLAVQWEGKQCFLALKKWGQQRRMTEEMPPEWRLHTALRVILRWLNEKRVPEGNETFRGPRGQHAESTTPEAGKEMNANEPVRLRIMRVVWREMPGGGAVFLVNGGIPRKNEEGT